MNVVLSESVTGMSHIMYHVSCWIAGFRFFFFVFFFFSVR